MKSHPLAKIFNSICTLPASYAKLIYYGVNAFKFTNQQDETHFVRYQFQPEEEIEYLTEEKAATAGPDYLFQEIRERLARQ